jgi:copper homeostasis protein (lipoprotein)
MRPHPAAILLAALALTGCMTRAAAPGPVHVARQSLDWPGTYRGVLPCADCEGIETTVVLSADGTYRAQAKYLGKGEEPFSEQGSFAWDAAGSSVLLQGVQTVRYAVGENRLTRLGLDGTPIEGALADRYVLTRLVTGVTETRWKLVELNGRKLAALDRTPYLVLSRSDRRVSGFGGCNAFGGSYELDEAHLRLRFGRIASTMRACLSGMAEEKELHEVLRRTDSFAVEGTTLSLTLARMAPLARFEAEAVR